MAAMNLSVHTRGIKMTVNEFCMATCGKLYTELPIENRTVVPFSYVEKHAGLYIEVDKEEYNPNTLGDSTPDDFLLTIPGLNTPQAVYDNMEPTDDDYRCVEEEYEDVAYPNVVLYLSATMSMLEQANINLWSDKFFVKLPNSQGSVKPTFILRFDTPLFGSTVEHRIKDLDAAVKKKSAVAVEERKYQIGKLKKPT